MSDRRSGGGTTVAQTIDARSPPVCAAAGQPDHHWFCFWKNGGMYLRVRRESSTRACAEETRVGAGVVEIISLMMRNSKLFVRFSPFNLQCPESSAPICMCISCVQVYLSYLYRAPARSRPPRRRRLPKKSGRVTLTLTPACTTVVILNPASLQ